MKKIVFYAHLYWEVHWMYRVVKTMNARIYSDNDSVVEEAKEMGLDAYGGSWGDFLASDEYDIVVSCTMHSGQNHALVQKFYDAGKTAVLMQHAWDSDLNILDVFWGCDMSKFNKYLVGSAQDEEWLREKHGDKIVYTGIPKLDDAYEIMNEETPQYIRDLVGSGPFFLSMIPISDVHGDSFRTAYFNLANSNEYKIVFKIHPGGDNDQMIANMLSNNPNWICIPDTHTDPLLTYRLIKASSGVLAMESFMVVEASLMRKPVIFYAQDQLSQDIYNRAENTRQRDRVPKNINSEINNPIVTQGQIDLPNLYKFDGQNTKRVVEYLYKLINE